MANIEVKTFSKQVEQTRKHIMYSFQRSHEALQERENLLLSRLGEIEKEYQQNSVSISNKENNRSIEFSFDPSFESCITDLGTIKLSLMKPSHKPIPNYKSKHLPVAYGCKNSTSKRACEFNSPRCLAVHRNTGNIYVVDRDNNRVQVFSHSLLYLFMFSDGMDIPRGICVGKDKVYVTQYDGNCISAYNLEGKLYGSRGSKGNGEGQFNSPLGITICSQTNDVYVCDRYNHRVQVFTEGLKFKSILGKGLFKSPRDVMAKRDRIFVLDCSDPCVSVFNSEHTLLSRIISRGEVMGGANSTSSSVDPSNLSPQLVSDIGSLNSGDVIFRPLEGVSGIIGFNHFGVYIGERDVIHFICDVTNGAGLIEKVDYEIFAQGGTVHIERDFSPNNSEKRPRRRIAQSALNLYYNLNGMKSDWEIYIIQTRNCEHFTTFCATGIKYSKQTRRSSPPSGGPGSFSSSSSSSESGLVSLASNGNLSSLPSSSWIPSSFSSSNMGVDSFFSSNGGHGSYSLTHRGHGSYSSNRGQTHSPHQVEFAAHTQFHD